MAIGAAEHQIHDSLNADTVVLGRHRRFRTIEAPSSYVLQKIFEPGQVPKRPLYRIERRFQFLTCRGATKFVTEQRAILFLRFRLRHAVLAKPSLLRKGELTRSQVARFLDHSFPCNGLTGLQRGHHERSNRFMHQIPSPGIHAFHLAEQKAFAPQRILRVVPGRHAPKEKLPLASPYPPVRRE